MFTLRIMQVAERTLNNTDVIAGMKELGSNFWQKQTEVNNPKSEGLIWRFENEYMCIRFG